VRLEQGFGIPRAFWDFMSQRGTVYENQRYMQNQQLFDWLFVLAMRRVKTRPIQWAVAPYVTNMSLAHRQTFSHSTSLVKIPSATTMKSRLSRRCSRIS